MASWLTRLIALAGAAAAIEIAKTLSESARQPDGNRSVPPPQPEPAPVPANSRHVQTDASHAPVTPEVFADRTDVFVPACKPFPAAEVRQITLTEQEAKVILSPGFTSVRVKQPAPAAIFRMAEDSSAGA